MSLAQRTALGAFWTISTGMLSRTLSLVCTLLLSQFMDPAEFGEVAVAVVVVGMAKLLAAAGLGQYIVTRPRSERSAVFHATLYFHALGALLLGGAYLGRDALGQLFGAPHMGRFVPGLVVATWLARISVPPEKVLVRDLRFKAQSLITALGEVAYGGVALLLAMLGAGGFAIVWGNLARGLVLAVLMLAVTERRDWLEVSRVTAARSREVLGFGLPVLVAGLADFGARRWDNLMVSSLHGETAAGLYSYAYNLADVPATVVGERIGDVLLPSFARIDPERRPAALIRGMTLSALLCFPLAVGLGAVAGSLARGFLSERWRDVGPMLALLSSLSLTRPPLYIAFSYLQALGRTNTVMLLEWIKALSIVLAIAATGAARPLSPAVASLGPLSACVAVGAAMLGSTLLYLAVVARIERISLWAIVRPLLPPLVACGPLVGAVLVVRGAMASRAPGWSLAAEILAGAVAFAASALLLAPAASKDLLGLAASVLRQRRGRAAGDAPQA